MQYKNEVISLTWLNKREWILFSNSLLYTTGFVPLVFSIAVPLSSLCSVAAEVYSSPIAIITFVGPAPLG
jgi:hypothetical protein